MNRMNSSQIVPRGRGEINDRKFVEALGRGLDVLRAFSSSSGTLGNQEISERTGLPKATVSRLTFTLTYLGYLRFVPSAKKYELDTGVLALGYIYLSKSVIRQIATPTMAALSKSTRTSIGLATRSRLSMDMIYIASVRANDRWPIRMEIGAHIPILPAATGRAWFAVLNSDERDQVLEYFERNLPKADRGRAKMVLERAVSDFEKNGFCSSLGEWDKTVNACSVPLRLRDGGIYVLNCGGPVEQMAESRINSELGPQLIGAAREILSKLGENDVLSA